MGEKLAEAAANQCLNKNIFSTDFARFPQYLPSEVSETIATKHKQAYNIFGLFI